ncbi:MgtC/SapB family protein [Clostridioides difficile]
MFIRNQSVSSLTTAAGIWATAGTGLAIGSGLYLVGLHLSSLHKTGNNYLLIFLYYLF